MASTFILKRKCFNEWGADARAAYRKGIEMGLSGKDLRNYVSLNSGATTAGAGLGNRFGGPTVVQAQTSSVTSGGNMVSLTGNTNYDYGKKYNGGVDNAFNKVTNTQNKLTNKGIYGNNSATVSNIGKKPLKPLNQVNKGTGLVNSWNKMGTMGKVGVGAGAVAGGYFLGKGLGLWGNNKEK